MAKVIQNNQKNSINLVEVKSNIKLTDYFLLEQGICIQFEFLNKFKEITFTGLQFCNEIEDLGIIKEHGTDVTNNSIFIELYDDEDQKETTFYLLKDFTPEISKSEAITMAANYIINENIKRKTATIIYSLNKSIQSLNPQKTF